MQARIDKLVKAINEDGKKPKKGGGMMQTVMILLLACVVALAAGFFGVTYLAQNG
jgi:flagellar basal body-associated protein FliL